MGPSNQQMELVIMVTYQARLSAQSLTKQFSIIDRNTVFHCSDLSSGVATQNARGLIKFGFTMNNPSLLSIVCNIWDILILKDHSSSEIQI